MGALMSGIGRLLTQTVPVKTCLGSDSSGPILADPADVACYIEDSVRMVRDSMGQEVVSSVRLIAALDAAPAVPPVAGQFTVNSVATVNGRDVQVLTAARRDGVGPTRCWHVEIALT